MYPADLLSRRFRGGKCYHGIRLSLSQLLVNQLQVVKRTNAPLIPLTNGVVDRGFFGSWVQIPHPPINFFRLSP